jgi:release factor glutamine methyltransferase
MSDDIRAGINGSAALTVAIRLLRAAGVDMPQRDARILLAWALNISTDRIALALSDGLNARSAERYQGAIVKRAQRMPVSLILGRREFYGLKFIVTADVLDPRPETETLVEQALSAPFSRLLDLGTGTGCILLSLLAERPDATGVGTDISPLGCAVAIENTQHLNLKSRARIVQSDWYDQVEGTFDLIVANPPYVTTGQMQALAPEVRDWDPELALAAGDEGLVAYRLITAQVMQYLAEGGRLIVEISPAQAHDVVGLFRRAGLQRVNVVCDLDGRDRVVIGHRVARDSG